MAIHLVAEEMNRDILISGENRRVTPPTERQKRSNFPDLEVVRQYDQGRNSRKKVDNKQMIDLQENYIQRLSCLQNTRQGGTCNVFVPADGSEANVIEMK